MSLNKYQPNFDDLIPLSQAGEIADLTPEHLRRLVREGKLWGLKIGRNWVTTEKAIRDYLDSNPKPGPKPKTD